MVIPELPVFIPRAYGVLGDAGPGTHIPKIGDPQPLTELATAVPFQEPHVIRRQRRTQSGTQLLPVG